MLSVVILAAGRGSRMKSNLPKVLHNICDKSMVEYLIDKSLQISDDIHIVLYHDKDRIIDFLSSRYKSPIIDKLHIHIQLHDIYPGTGGALMDNNKNLIELKWEKILILNGDTPLFSVDSMRALVDSTSSINVAGCIANNPEGYGRLMLDKELANNTFILKDIIEERDCKGLQLQIAHVNGGIYCIRKDILQECLPMLENNNAQKEYYLTDIISIANKPDAKACIYTEHELIGINTKEHLAMAQDIMLENLRGVAMQEGVIMHMPSSIYIGSRVKFIGECILEQGVKIEGDSVIKDSIIKANTIIKDSIIEQSDIGPNAHIRPHCEIKQSHIGNFVECKNAKLQGIKAGHLSYLGDCIIYEGTNIGAGVITCNYDGKSKHKTIIGKNVFVGSDSQLIAPIEIEDNSIIAAGSTINTHVHSGSLAISRMKQKNIKDGFYKIFPKN